MKSTPALFHWALPVDVKCDNEAKSDTSGAVDLEKLVKFVRQADESPIDSLLTPFGFHMPDPFPLLGLLSNHSRRVGFLLAYRSGFLSPTLFVQQMNTLSQLIPHRLSLNLVAGFSPEEQAFYGDHLSHDDRYERSEEFLRVSLKLWSDQEPVTFSGRFFDIRAARLTTLFNARKNSRPKIYMSGNSKIAQSKAHQLTDCWLRYADTVEAIEKSLKSMNFTSAGLRFSIISGESRAEAIERAARVVANPDENWKKFLRAFVSRCDSEAVKSTFSLAEKKSEWLSPHLWSGVVPYRGGPAMSVVGDYDEIALQLFRYKQAGVSEFILSGWSTEEELKRFSNEIYPRFRQLELEDNSYANANSR